MSFVDANGTYPVPAGHYHEVAELLARVDGNPSSQHARGRHAKVALEEARAQVAQLLGAKAATVTFTAGATEANNLALQGVIYRGQCGAKLPHVVVTAAEHASVLEPAQALAQRGVCRLDIAPVHPTGEVDSEALLALVGPETALVACMHANNETGAISPVLELATKIKAKQSTAHVHVDAVQMLGKADLRAYATSAVDSAAFSGHKIGGFKGCGALYLRPGVQLQALVVGGGQERGRRPGTENMPGIVSFGLRAASVFGQEPAAAAAMQALRSALLSKLTEISGAVVHGGSPTQLPNTVNFHVEGVSGDDILLNLDLAGVQASSGSACSSSVARPSHVLLAMGYSDWAALNSVRISFAADSPANAVDQIGQILEQVLERVR